MSTDAIGYILAAVASIMSYVAVRGRHLLLSVSTAGLWASLLAYVLSNSTAGQNWQQIFAISAIGFIFALFLLGAFRDIRTNKNVSEGGQDYQPTEMDRGNGGGLRKLVRKLNGDDDGHGVIYSSHESSDAYRSRVHHALRRDERRRRI